MEGGKNRQKGKPKGKQGAGIGRALGAWQKSRELGFILGGR